MTAGVLQSSKEFLDTETQGRVHTSTITVAVIPEVDDVEVDIKP